MKLTLLFLLFSTSCFSQITLDTTHKNFSHQFSLSHPISLFHGSRISIAGHYNFSFDKKEKSNKELQIGYTLYKYSAGSGWLSPGQLNGNSQMFSILYGGRFYANKQKNKIRPYVRVNIGGEFINYESGKNRILPAFSGGVHLEFDHRFNVGIDIEGLMPIAYLKVGYRFY